MELMEIILTELKSEFTKSSFRFICSPLFSFSQALLSEDKTAAKTQTPEDLRNLNSLHTSRVHTFSTFLSEIEMHGNVTFQTSKSHWSGLGDQNQTVTKSLDINTEFTN